MPNKIKFISIFFLVLFTSSTLSYAQSIFAIKCGPLETYISVFDMCLNFAQGLGLLISWLLILGTLFAGIRISIAAVSFVTSQGDPQKLQNAREALTDAFLGLILLVSAWIILGYINATFPEEWHIDLLKFAP